MSVAEYNTTPASNTTITRTGGGSIGVQGTNAPSNIDDAFRQIMADIAGGVAFRAIKHPCVVETTANITLSGTQTINTVAVVADDRVLVKNQTDASQNGVYVASASAWSRAVDFDENGDIENGTMVSVATGTRISYYSLSFSGTLNLGVTDLTFSPAAMTGEMTPYQFGATGDGSTDDTAALDAASAVAVTAGVPLYFPNGTFLTDNVTLAADLVFTGGKIKPASGQTATLSGSINVMFAPKATASNGQAFDISAGGTIAGNARVKDSTVYAEWWGADATVLATNNTTFIQAAIDFLEQRGFTSGNARGGIVRLLQGWYTVTSELTINTRGVSLKGAGMWSTFIYKTGNINAVKITGSLADGQLASYGTRIENIGFWSSTNAPTAGAMICLDEIDECKIKGCLFYDYFRGIEATNCQGSQVKEISGCNFVRAMGTAVGGGSANIALLGDAAGAGTGLCERFYIHKNTGTTTGIDYGLYIDGADTSHVVSNHFAGNTLGTLYIASSTTAVYNMHFANNTWEGLNTDGSAYGIYIANTGQDVMGSMMFVNEQILNGSTNAVYVGGGSGKQPKNIHFTNCDVIQAINHAVHIDDGAHITWSGGTIVDTDINSAGSKGHFIIGNGSTNLDDLRVSGVSMAMENFAGSGTLPSNPFITYGFLYQGGENIELHDNTISNTAFPIAATGTITNVDCERNRIPVARTTITVTTTNAAIAPQLGEDKITVSASSASLSISTITAATSSRNRRITLYFTTNAVNINHAAGGTYDIWLKGRATKTYFQGDFVTLEFDQEIGQWFEV